MFDFCTYIHHYLHVHKFKGVGTIFSLGGGLAQIQSLSCSVQIRAVR